MDTGTTCKHCCTRTTIRPKEYYTNKQHASATSLERTVCLTAHRAESALAWRLDMNSTGGFRVLPMGSSVPVVPPKSAPSSSSDRYTILAAYLCDDSPALVPKTMESDTMVNFAPCCIKKCERK